MVLTADFAWNFNLFLVDKNYFFSGEEPTFFNSDIFLWSHSVCFDKLLAFFVYFCMCMKAWEQ